MVSPSRREAHIVGVRCMHHFGSPLSSAFDSAKSCLQNQQILRRSFPDCGEWNAGIESNEPSFMMNRESEQINVSQLPRSMNSSRIHNFRVQQTHLIRPEFMDILVAGIG